MRAADGILGDDRGKHASPATDSRCGLRILDESGNFRYTSLMPNRADDWLIQAQRNIEQAEASREDGRHEWACFAAQQAGELAVKALHLNLGQEAWGHVVAKLLSELPVSTPTDLVEKAKVLDNFYIPTRYPNGHSEGAPYRHYGTIQSGEAIRYAGEILGFVRHEMAGR